MWYEILPAFSIIVACMGVGMTAGSWISQAMIDKPHGRFIKTPTQRFMCRRDERLTGDTYKIVGLENIPDGSEK